MATATDDPIRAEVERVLTAVVTTALTLPFAIVTFVPRCMLRQATAFRRRLMERANVARTLIDLVGGGADQVAAPGAGDPPTTTRRRPVATDHLPIDEYESLAASQVVARLPTLTEDELAAVRAFEAAHRGRRTILGRIDQLLG